MEKPQAIPPVLLPTVKLYSPKGELTIVNEIDAPSFMQQGFRTQPPQKGGSTSSGTKTEDK